MPDFLKEVGRWPSEGNELAFQGNTKLITDTKSGANGNGPRVPAIYASAVRSDKEATSPSDVGPEKISWYADYV